MMLRPKDGRLEDGPLLDPCARARILAGATYASAWQLQGGELVLVACAGLTPAPVRLPLDSSRSAAARSLALRVPVFIPQTRRASDIAHSMARITGVRSLLCVPILERDRAIGVLLVAWRSPPDELGSGLIGELRVLAREMAGALSECASAEEDQIRAHPKAPATDLSATVPIGARPRRGGRVGLRSGARPD